MTRAALDESGLGSRPFVIGAGAAVSQYVGCTAEAMPNVWLGPCRKFGSKYAAVCDDGTIRQVCGAVCRVCLQV